MVNTKYDNDTLTLTTKEDVSGFVLTQAPSEDQQPVEINIPATLNEETGEYTGVVTNLPQGDYSIKTYKVNYSPEEEIIIGTNEV